MNAVDEEAFQAQHAGLFAVTLTLAQDAMVYHVVSAPQNANAN